MSPVELKKLARESSKKEYEAIMAEMKKVAQGGSFSAIFPNIRDGAREQLIEKGFNVVKKHKNSTGAFVSSHEYYEVSFSK